MVMELQSYIVNSYIYKSSLQKGTLVPSNFIESLYLKVCKKKKKILLLSGFLGQLFYDVLYAT